jgi:hypothetical protein
MSHSGSGLGALSMQRLGCRTGSIWRCSTLTEPGMRLQILANWRWSVIFLAFEIVLDGGFIFVSAQLCDRGHPPGVASYVSRYSHRLAGHLPLNVR